MPANQKQGGKNRKLGRHSRNPSSKMQAARTLRNKARRERKQAKFLALCKEKRALTLAGKIVPRGTARAKRRAALHLSFGSRA